MGAVIPMYALACVSSPPRKWYASSESPRPRASFSSSNRFVSLSASHRLMCMWHPLPVRLANGFGMNVASSPRLCAIMWTM